MYSLPPYNLTEAKTTADNLPPHEDDLKHSKFLPPKTHEHILDKTNNELYAGTDDAWLYVDYSLPPYNLTEAETTAYKLPQYEEDLDCYNCTTPKTNAEILAELEALDPEFVEF